MVAVANCCAASAYAQDNYFSAERVFNCPVHQETVQQWRIESARTHSYRTYNYHILSGQFLHACMLAKAADTVSMDACC